MFKIILGLCVFLSTIARGETVSYTKGDIPFASIEQLPNEAWTPMGDQLYLGNQNGVYWLKVVHLKMPSPFVITIPQSHVFEAELYFPTGKVLQPIPNSRMINFQIESSEKFSMVYMKVDFKKEAILSLEISPLNKYFEKEARTRMSLGVYYGIVLIVILINLFSLFNFRRRTYLHYVIMLFSITLGLAASDGFIRMLFDSDALKTYAEPFFNLCVALILPILANSYMNLQKHIPQVNGIGIVLAEISIILFLCYTLTGNFTVFAWAEVSALALVTTYWVAGALIFKKSWEARVFTIAYFIICFSCYDFYIARSFGFSFIGLTLDQFRIGAIVEMLVFTFAINYQGKLLLVENQKMRHQLLKYSQGEEGKELLAKEMNAKLIKEYNLTPKEILILQSISKGKINKEIAEEQYVSINTVKFHIKKIYEKLETSSRQEARQKYFSIVQ